MPITTKTTDDYYTDHPAVKKKPRLLVSDLTGGRVPYGQTRVSLVDEHFVGKTALPTSLAAAQLGSTTGAAAGMTTTFATPSATEPGHLSVMSAATTDSLARIETTQQFPIGQYQALLFELDGFRLDASSPTVEIAIFLAGSSTGGYATEVMPIPADADPTFNLFAGGVAGGVPVSETWRGFAEGQNRRNVWLLASSPLKELAMGEADKSVGWRDCSTGWNDGMVRAAIQVRTKEAVSHGFRLTALRVTGWLK